MLERAAGRPVEVELQVALVVAVGMLAVVRPSLARRLHTGPELRLGHGKLVGTQGTVTETVTALAPGRVRLGGEIWTAQPYDETLSIEPGETVEVFEIRGATPRVMRNVAANVDAYTFDPSGRDIALFATNSPRADFAAWHSAAEWELPRPIPCRLLGEARYTIGDVEVADLDRGYWRLYKDGRFAGYTGKSAPAHCVNANNAATLRFEGIAEAAAAAGAIVPVRNPDTGKVVHARVNGEGQARINLSGKEN